MNNNSERQKIVLAALLHDIGKFYQRADDKWDSSAIITKEFPNKNFNHTVPVYENGNPKYIHALWTQAFFSKFGIDKMYNFENKDDNNVATLAARHHLKGSFQEQIIGLADKWSSSIDRPDEGEEGVEGYENIKSKWGNDFVNKVPLTSIFDYILKSNDDVKLNAYKLSKLDVFDDEVVFPLPLTIDKNNSLADQYKKHLQKFELEIAKLVHRNPAFPDFYESLLDILRNFLWCIPSATNVSPANVNLYEHLKTTAGLAICLYDYISEKRIDSADNLQDLIRQEDSLLMLCIDISGIQKFIYDIANKKAAKSLKGRSFYLQLLMQSIIDKILAHPDVMGFSANIIYASGGKAYLIMPNLDKVKKAINKIDNEIQEYLWKEYQGKIYSVFGTISFNYETCLNTNNGHFTNIIKSYSLTPFEYIKIGKNDKYSLDLGDIWRIASDRASEAKHKKFISKVKDFSIFNPEKYPEDSEKCAVTGVRYPKSEMINIEDDDKKELLVCRQVADQYKLGEALKRGNYIVAYRGANKNVNFDIEILGIKYEVKSSETINSLPINDFETATIFVLNKGTEQLNISYPNVALKTAFYGGNIQPLNSNGSTKSFEDLVKISEDKRTKLGVLRMDVDGLGNIFINGFDEKVQKKSFAAYSTLSFMLEVFFCGFINNIQLKSEFKDHIQILYSGGDDLFAIGRWEKIIDFAEKVQKEFKRFTGRKDITISAGVAIVDAKYPISKSSDLAGEAESEAKKWNNKTKNAINFFGETVSWDEEFEYVKGLKDQFIYFESVTGRALLHQIQNYKLIKDNGIKKETQDLSYKWHSAYSLTRALERIKKEKNPDSYDFVESIRKNILHNEKFGADRYLDLIAIAARWAEMELKNKIIDNKLNI